MIGTVNYVKVLIISVIELNLKSFIMYKWKPSNGFLSLWEDVHSVEQDLSTCFPFCLLTILRKNPYRISLPIKSINHVTDLPGLFCAFHSIRILEPGTLVKWRIWAICSETTRPSTGIFPAGVFRWFLTILLTLTWMRTVGCCHNRSGIHVLWNKWYSAKSINQG